MGDLMFEIVLGPTGCSFCDYGLSSYNYLSNMVLKLRLSVIITPPYILCIIAFEPPTKLAGSMFLSHFPVKTLRFKGAKTVSSCKKANDWHKSYNCLLAAYIFLAYEGSC